MSIGKEVPKNKNTNFIYTFIKDLKICLVKDILMLYL